MDETIGFINCLDVDRDQYFEQVMGDEMAIMLLTGELTKYQLLLASIWSKLSKKQ